ncbi:MAG: carbohydrate ABC transporter permease [Clostridia bacterium]|nr:carbohydrate ABC transporter permease [Clostridia bacterium]
MKRAKNLKGYSVFDRLLVVFFTLFALLMIYPVYYVFVGSFNRGLDYISGGVYLFPREFTFDNYRVVFADGGLWRAYFITVSRTILGTFTAITFTSIVAYAMSRKELPFKKIIYFINIFTMFFSGGLIPFFLLIKTLGLYDTYALYIVPCAYSVYHMIIISNFFRSLPEELREAAVLDGAGEFRILFSVAIPLSVPVIATVSLWIAIGHWNSYFDAMVYTSSEGLVTLQFYLMKLINSQNVNVGAITLPASVTENLTAEVVTFATIVVSILPVMFIFPFISKYFEKGIMMGSIKG